MGLEIVVETATRTKFRVKLLIDNDGVDIQRLQARTTWVPHRRLEIPHICQVTAVLKAGRTVLGVPLGRREAHTDISGQEITEVFWNAEGPEILVQRQVRFDGLPASIIFEFRSSPTAESTRSALHNLQVAMEDYKHLMASSTQEHVAEVDNYALALSEMNPFAKAALAVLSTTFELLKEQQKYDNMVSDLADGVGGILPLVRKVQEQTVDNYIDLEAEIGRLLDLAMDTAGFICSYLRRSPLKRMAKSITFVQDRTRIEELIGELENLAVDFDRAINIEAPGTVGYTKYVEEDRFLRGRLQPVEAGYSRDRCCMDNTRKAILDDTMSWAIQSRQIDGTPQTPKAANMFWLYGIPGIGKTSVANSLCSRLHDKKKLGGSFFCRRDDPRLSDPKYVLPTLIFELAGTWRPYRKSIVEKLQADPELNIESVSDALFLDILKGLEKSPTYPLVLVIDALDECGDARTRRNILKPLFDASSQHSWLRIIVTSRPEQDIETSFQHLDNTYLQWSKDLAKDEQAYEDIHLFAKRRFSDIAAECHLGDAWPDQKLLGEIVTRARGLFIYVETVWRLVRDEPDPEKLLIDAVRETSGDATDDLYKLYSTAVESRIGRDKEGFRRAIGVIISVALHRPLRDKTVAKLAGVEEDMVLIWMDSLNSLLYRDDEGKGEIRVRHLSIIDFFTSPRCPKSFRVDIKQAHLNVGLACLRTMVDELKFNICNLESSLIQNDDVKDLMNRIEENISDALQYSCIHWSSHVCYAPYSKDSTLAEHLDALFTNNRPLYWIEVLSMLGKVGVGIQELREVISWAKNSKVGYVQCANDALQFLLTFYTCITISAPHIYVSGLPFVPRESEIGKKASESFQKGIKVEKGRMETWPTRPETWLGHTSFVTSIASSPDGCHVVSGSFDGTIQMWDAETGRAIGELWEGHSFSVWSVAYSPDGQHVISSSSDKTIRMWDIQSGREVGKPWEGHTHSVNTLAYSPDGHYVVSGSSDGTIRIWDAETGEAVGEPWEGRGWSVRSVAYSPDGGHVVSGTERGELQIWDAKTGRAAVKQWMGHNEIINSVAYSPNGRNIVSGSNDKTIRIWDAKTGEAVGEPWEGHEWGVCSVAYSPDGHQIISGSNDRTIRMWDAQTGRPIGEPWKGHTSSVNSVTYSPNGRYVISGSYEIRMWDAQTGRAAGKPWEGHTDFVQCVAYSPDGHQIISGSDDNTIRMWDAQTGRAVGKPWEGHTGYVKAITYSPDGRHVVSGSSDWTLQKWDVKTGEAIGKPWEGHTRDVCSIAYSPDGRHVVSGSVDKTIRKWDAETGQVVSDDAEPWRGHTNGVLSVAYSPDGHYVVSSSADRTIRKWDAETGEAVGKPWEGHTGYVSTIAYSADGCHVVSGSGDETIRIWDAETGRAIGEPWEGHTDFVRCVAYSPDGHDIISGSDDKTIRMWDAKTGRAVGKPWEGHTGVITSIAYSPDGQCVVTGSTDETIRVWDTNYPAQTGDNQHHIVLPSGRLHPNTLFISGLQVRLISDSSGWIHHPDGGLLLWVPEDCRHGLVCPAILTISTNGRYQAVTLDFTDFQYSTSWHKVKTAKQ